MLGAHDFDLAIGSEAVGLFFDNVDVASVLDEFICRNVS
jgi:hypothetical protein